MGRVFCCSVRLKLLLQFPQCVFFDGVLGWARFQRVTRSREICLCSSTSARRRLAGLVPKPSCVVLGWANNARQGSIPHSAVFFCASLTADSTACHYIDDGRRSLPTACLNPYSWGEGFKLSASIVGILNHNMCALILSITVVAFRWYSLSISKKLEK